MPGIALIVGTRPLPWAGKARAPLPSSPAEKAPTALAPELGDRNVENVCVCGGGNLPGGGRSRKRRPPSPQKVTGSGYESVPVTFQERIL